MRRCSGILVCPNGRAGPEIPFVGRKSEPHANPTPTPTPTPAAPNPPSCPAMAFPNSRHFFEFLFFEAFWAVMSSLNRPPASGNRGSPPPPSRQWFNNQTRQAERTAVPSTTPTPQTPTELANVQPRRTEVLNHYSPDVLSALHIPLCTSRFRLTRRRQVPLPPSPPTASPFSMSFPRHNSEIPGRKSCPMKINSTPYSRC